MNYLYEDYLDYIERYSKEESAILKRLDRETNLKTMFPKMVAGKLQGNFLKMITKMINPKTVLEIGTFTGYSAICFAESLMKEGIVYTIEINPEWQYISDKYFKESGLQEKIIAMNGDAADIIKSLDVNFDLVYIDADKQNNKKYYDMLLASKMKPNSYIIIDNVLWGGKVLHPELHHDKDTKIIQSFNDYVFSDERVDSIIIPLRDGLTIVRVK